MKHGWIAISEVMGGLVILNMHYEQPNRITTQDPIQEKFVRSILTLAYLTYLRAVAASGITVALAIVADIHPAYATMLGAIVAPIAKALDPKSGSEADYGINAS